LFRVGAGLALFKLIISLAVLATGYEGVSDDDYARVVIAQQFAHAPALDPSGTSWLPLPFWINGGAMLAFGTHPIVARAVAVVLGIASILLIRVAAGYLTRDPREAFVATVIAAIMPWSARLGVSMVPELPAAACSLFAIATLSKQAPPRARLAGAIALLCACLSRYEAWFIAIAFAGVCVRDAIHADRRLVSIASAALPLAGPIAWTVWNERAHGSYFHYLDSVTAYKDAVDQGALGERVFAYVFAAFRAEPELLLLFVFLCWRMFAGRRSVVRAELASFFRPTLMVAFLFVALTASSIRGGAPTHHPERALLSMHLLLAIVTGALLVRVYRERRFGDMRRVLIGTLAIAPLFYMLRFWVLYREAFAHRKEELAIGRRIADTIAIDERVLYPSPPDYGHYAIQAGSGRPWQFDVRHSPGGARYLLLTGEAAYLNGATAVFCDAGPSKTRPGFPVCLYAVDP